MNLRGSVRTKVDSPLEQPKTPAGEREGESPPLPVRIAPTRILTLTLLSAPVVFLAWAAWSHRWVADDAFIHFRVVSQLLAGHGPVFNAGERVETSTSPAWVAMLAMGSVLPIAREMLALLLGLGLSLWALVAGQWGALALARSRRSQNVALPVGALVLVALPPFWDFATSGLETGLEFGWLATIFWGIARFIRRRADGDTRQLPSWLPIAAGLGVLIRPDLGLFCLAYIGVMVWLQWNSGRRSIIRTILLAAAIPVCFEILRMGYYGMILPNTAVAKSATGSYWSHGWRYLVDFVSPYRLWFPVAVVLCLSTLVMARLPQRVRRDGSILIIALLVTSLIYVIYVVHLGGDFMHARMLLPVVVAICLPIAAVEASTAGLLGGGAILVWSVLCAVGFRTPYTVGTGVIGNQYDITNEANYYRSSTHNAHPVYLSDYRRTRSPIYLLGREYARQVAQGQRRVQGALRQDLGRKVEPIDLPLATNVRAPFVGAVDAFMGIIGYGAPNSVYVDDDLGLADPIGSHLILTHRSRPGHEKRLPTSWIVARFADPQSWASQSVVPLSAIQDADAALHCGNLSRLLTSVSSPLTPRRFVGNFFHSLTLTRFQVPPDPQVARHEFCK